MYACKCLNVIIHTKNDENPVTAETLKLHDVDPFFKKAFLSIVAQSITKQQSGLIIPRHIGFWIVHKCLNCSLDTHAIHRDKGASCVLIAENLLSGAANISALRNSDNYSSSFGILVNIDDDGDIEPSIAGYQILASVSQLPESLQVAVKGLQQQLNNIVRREVASTEDRVRRYTEMQHTALLTFRDKVHREHNSLLRLVLNSQLMALNVGQLSPSPIKTLHLSSEPKMVNAFEVQSSDNDEICGLRALPAKPKHPAVTSLSKSKRNIGPRLCNSATKMDSEDGILFPMDGMEENSTSVHSDAEESDTDDSASHDEGIHIPRQRIPSANMAKSLPMNIPIFLSTFPHEILDEREETKEDLVDIAASIKALAKSVHGDDVFGDLPRPRFSTQI